MKYNQLLETHFFNPKNVFKASEQSDCLFEVSLGKKVLGDAFKLYIDVEQDTLKIIKFTYSVYGNPYLIAALSLTSELVNGLSMEALETLDLQSTLIESLEIPQTKHYVVYMLEDGLKKIIELWQKQNDKYDRKD